MEILDTHNEPRNTTQIVHLLTAVLEQNYFSYQNVIYRPGNGVAMGSATSGTVAEIFLQHLEESHVPHFLDTHHIVYYTRYVDDIFIVYDSNLTNPGTITHHANSLHHNIKLIPTTETNNTINFLDLNITRTPTGLSIDIYRKPTTTDTTINHHIFWYPPCTHTHTAVFQLYKDNVGYSFHKSIHCNGQTLNCVSMVFHQDTIYTLVRTWVSRGAV
jgi:hypothetical protein